MNRYIKYFLILLLAGAMLAFVFAYDYYKAVFNPNVPNDIENEYINIPTGASFEEVVQLLKTNNFIENEDHFKWVAQKMKYIKNPMRSGRFKIKPGWNNRQLISHLRAGKQSTVKLVINHARMAHQVAGVAARFIEADSLEIVNLLQSKSFLSKHGYTPETVISMFIPNTYDFYWNTNAEKFFEKMEKEHKAFWEKKNRIKKAKKLKMTPIEVYTLASIVERETRSIPEKPRVAGLYLNRLKKGMRLEADPTVVFANQKFDLRRVLNKHLEFESPYNTYLHTGLPPGPISLASISSIDAVLNAEDHQYIFMCAKPDNSGQHAFAKTLSGHNVNANKYRRWLKQQGIR